MCVFYLMVSAMVGVNRYASVWYDWSFSMLAFSLLSLRFLTRRS
jgi:hypothetical protein